MNVPNAKHKTQQNKHKAVAINMPESSAHIQEIKISSTCGDLLTDRNMHPAFEKHSLNADSNDSTADFSLLNPTHFLSTTFEEGNTENFSKNVSLQGLEMFPQSYFDDWKSKGIGMKCRKQQELNCSGDGISQQVTTRLMTVSRHKKSAPRKVKCARTVSSESSLQSGHFPCSHCDEYFTQKQLLRRHLKLHATCTDNKKETVGSDTVNTIDSTVLDKKEYDEVDDQLHPKGHKHTLYTCRECGVDCKTKSVYVQHIKTHTNVEKKAINCHVCGKEFKFKSLLLNHLECHKSKIKVDKSLSCKVCGKRYTKIGSLTKHELQHEGKGKFRCRICGEVFSSDSDRTKHRDEVHEKPWKCHICNHSFAVQVKLESHIKWHKSKESEVFVCSVCGKEFKLKVNLKVHVESRCGTDPQHVCQVCGKAFMTRGTLVTHALLHTGEKTFLCRFCGKSFRLKVEMQRHERSHTGEKPFVCKVCNKAFAHRESLVTHNTLHTGVRPYMCEACGATFSCIGNLIKHRKTHRNKCGGPSTDNTKKEPTSLQGQQTVNTDNARHVDKSPATIPSHQKVGGCMSAILPTTASTYYSYRHPDYKDSHEWINAVYPTTDPVMERMHPDLDMHCSGVERSLKISQHYWNPTLMGVHPGHTHHSSGVYATDVKDNSKQELQDRPFSFCGSGEEMLHSSGKPLNYLSTSADENILYKHRIQTFEADTTYFSSTLKPDEMQKLYSSKTSVEKLQHFPKDKEQVTGQVLNRTKSLMPMQAASNYEAGVVTNNIAPKQTRFPTSDELIAVADIGAKGFASKFTDNGADKSHIIKEIHITSEVQSAECMNVELFDDTAHSSGESDDLCELENKSKAIDNTNCASVGRINDGHPVIQFDKTEITKKFPRERKQKCPLKFEFNCKTEEEGSFVCDGVQDEKVTTLSCSACGQRFAQPHLLQTHIMHDECVVKDNVDEKSVSDEDEPLAKRLVRCLQKNEQFHLDSNKKFLCQYCNKEFDFISRLNRHRKLHVKDKKEAPSCRFCDKKYLNKACLLKHELQHTSSGVFQCRQCEEGFNSKAAYRTHRLQQHGKKHVCEQCQRVFSTASNLKIHVNNKHTEKTPQSYACSACGKQFKQKGNLKVHEDSRCGAEPRHTCPVCGKAFMTAGSLGTHLLLHTGDKTFLCRFCGKSYRLKVEMQRHERSHTGEKPFKCKVCGKAFAHRESLVTHNTLHTGVRPYMCEACGATFSCIGNLIKHRQTHNKRCQVVGK